MHLESGVDSGGDGAEDDADSDHPTPGRHQLGAPCLAFTGEYIFVFFVVQSGQVSSEKFMYIGHWRIGEPDYWPVTRRSSDLVMRFPNTVTMY